MLDILQPSTLRRRTLRRHARTRTIVVAVLATAVLSVATVVALGTGDSAPAGVSPAVSAEAANQGLDPVLLTAFVEQEGVSVDPPGARTELRSAARRLRGGIDRHRSVVGALAATRVGDERVSRWLSNNPEITVAPRTIPDAGARDFVLSVLSARSEARARL